MTIKLSDNSREVHPGLWIGAFPTDPDEIKASGFDIHLDVRGESPRDGQQAAVETYYLPLWDDPTKPVNQDVLARVKVAAKKLAAFVRCGKKVLITCMGGFNRSALVAGFVMHELTGRPGAEAIPVIREKRGCTTPELAAHCGLPYDPTPNRALNNPQFVAALEALKEKAYDADLLIYDVVGGAYTKSHTADDKAILGGSELEVIQIAHGLARAGHKVVVANRIERAERIDGVDYVPAAEVVGMRVKTLHVQRHSPAPLPAVEADKVIVRTTDMNEPAYRTHAEILVSGNASLLCVSKWQASQFPSAKSRFIVPTPLGAMPLVNKVKDRFVFLSSPGKGAEPTIGVWLKLKKEHPELKDAKLLVACPAYKFGHLPSMTDEMAKAGIEYVQTPSLAGYRELLASAQGVFFVSAYTETACMIAAMAERSHTRFHCWPMTNKGGIPEMLTNHRLLAESQEQFEADFLAAYKEPDRSEWYATGALKDLSVDAVLPIWERAYGLVAAAENDPAAPEEIPQDPNAAAQAALPQPFIATPAYGGMMTMPYVSSVVGAMVGLQKLGLNPTLHFLGNESLITRARNNCVADFLKSNCTHLVFVDADIGFAAQHLVDMLCSELDVVFGAYPKKNVAWDKVLLAAQSGLAKTPQDLELYMADWAINFHEDSTASGKFKVLERGGMAFMSVKEASTGFCCFSRSAIERMIERFGTELEYISDSNVGYGEKRYALFDCPICPEGFSDAEKLDLQKAARDRLANPGPESDAAVIAAAEAFATSVKDKPVRYLSEDYGFSRRWASMGGEVYVYVQAALTHTGTFTFGGSFKKMFDQEVEDATTYVAP